MTAFHWRIPFAFSVCVYDLHGAMKTQSTGDQISCTTSSFEAVQPLHSHNENITQTHVQCKYFTTAQLLRFWSSLMLC